MRARERQQQQGHRSGACTHTHAWHPPPSASGTCAGAGGAGGAGVGAGAPIAGAGAGPPGWAAGIPGADAAGGACPFDAPPPIPTRCPSRATAGNSTATSRNGDGDEGEAADGVGRRIPSVPIPHHTHILLARARAPYSPPRLRNGSFAHASRSGGQRNFLELQALHPAQPPAPVLYSDCTLLYTGRSLDPRNITGAQRASSARSVSPLVCSSDCLRVAAARTRQLCGGARGRCWRNLHPSWRVRLMPTWSLTCALCRHAARPSAGRTRRRAPAARLPPG